jgi:spore coat polysaccharide biosynthesis protein SpsF
MGRPAISYLMERVAKCRGIDEAVVATSTDKSDDAIKGYCGRCGINCFRGDLLNVAGRFKGAAEYYRLDGFVRLSADSPFLDQALVDRAAALLRQGAYDIVSNVQKRTFPRGESVEAVSTGAFMRAYPLMRDAGDREHVTRYFYLHQDEFRIFNFTADGDYSGTSLAIDIPEDAKAASAIISLMDRPHWEYGLAEIIKLRHRAAAVYV